MGMYRIRTGELILGVDRSKRKPRGNARKKYRHSKHITFINRSRSFTGTQKFYTFEYGGEMKSSFNVTELEDMEKAVLQPEENQEINI